MASAAESVRRLWTLCSILRDEGVTYHEYLTELTYLLFLKLAAELDIEEDIPVQYRWDSLLPEHREGLLDHYKRLLTDLGDASNPLLNAIFSHARTRIRTDGALSKLVQGFVQIDWYEVERDGLGDTYEGLIQKSAQESRYGAGQYFTPRALVDAIVAALQPTTEDTVYDPAAGTAGFLVAAGLKVRSTQGGQPALRGAELVPEVHRLALMNLLLHGLEAEVFLGDALPESVAPTVCTLCMTNPPFGIKGSIAAEAGHHLDFPTSNKQLAFVQHVYKSLGKDARAAVVVPDNVLFESGVAAAIRGHLMDRYDVHTVLRLPPGIFYATGIKTSVLFFADSGHDHDATRSTWFYDLRNGGNGNGSPGRRKQLQVQDFHDFLDAYGDDPRGRSRRRGKARFWEASRDDIRRVGDRLDLEARLPGREDNTQDSPSALIAVLLSEMSAATAALRVIGELLATANRPDSVAKDDDG